VGLVVPLAQVPPLALALMRELWPEVSVVWVRRGRRAG
jgi:hypothetical protein